MTAAWDPTDLFGIRAEEASDALRPAKFAAAMAVQEAMDNLHFHDEDGSVLLMDLGTHVATRFVVMPMIAHRHDQVCGRC